MSDIESFPDATASCKQLVSEARELSKGTAHDLTRAVPSTSVGAISEADMLATREHLAKAKHALIDLQTKKSMAASLTSENPFAPLESESDRGARAADYASKRSEVKASKALVEAEHEKIAAHTDAVSQLMVETAARAARTDAAIAELSEELRRPMPGDGVLTMAGTLDLTVPALPASRATDGTGDLEAAAGGAGAEAAVAVPTKVVTLRTEADAQAFLSEMALQSSSLRSAALADSAAALRAQETARSLEAHIAQLQQWVRDSQAARAVRAGAVVTHEQRARVVEAGHVQQLDALAAVFRAPPTAALPPLEAADE